MSKKSDFHIGLICPVTSGHLNPTLTLGKFLSIIGYRVTFFGWIESKKLVEEKYQLRFIPYSVDTRPDNFMAQCIEEASTLNGLKSVKYTLDLWTKNIKDNCLELPDLFRREKLDLLIADHAFPEMVTIGEYINLPTISLCNAVVNQFNPKISPDFKLSKYGTNGFQIARHIIRYIRLIKAAFPMLNGINMQRKAWGMPILSGNEDMYSKRAIISQQTHDLEFPLDSFTEKINYVGPLIDAEEAQKDLNIEFEEDLPLIYASLGTINTGLSHIYEIISQTCQKLDVNLVISLGRPLEASDEKLFGNRVKVFSYVNQLGLLKACDLCITHAGMNTTMHCIYSGVPMIAIPLGSEQPGIASRIAWNKAGIALDFRKLTQENLTQSILGVLSDPSYKKRLAQYQSNCHEAGGITEAVKVIETEIEKLSKPVLATV